MTDTTLPENASFADITVPELKSVNAASLYDFSNNISDYSSLEELSEAITQARISLFKITENINKYERLERKARVAYERAYRRTLLMSVEKTELMKRARADLMNEGLENEVIVNEQVKNELVRMSHAVRLELQTLQSVSNNMRQQMKMEQ